MPPSSDCFYRVSIKALILDETRTKFLIVQETSGFWELPGGGLEYGEKPAEALKREIQEEMGLEVTFIADRPAYVITDPIRGGRVHRANLIYEAEVRGLDFTPSNECVAIRFVTPAEIADLGDYAKANIGLLAQLFDPSHFSSRGTL
jgi:8-oxo-dGTP pyrophosphatase MutT (NUDIX family)